MAFKLSGNCKVFCGLCLLFGAQSVYLYTSGTAKSLQPPLSAEVQQGFKAFMARNQNGNGNSNDAAVDAEMAFPANAVQEVAGHMAIVAPADDANTATMTMLGGQPQQTTTAMQGTAAFGTLWKEARGNMPAIFGIMVKMV